MDGLNQRRFYYAFSKFKKDGVVIFVEKLNVICAYTI